jgi:hypothetical protein
MIIFVHRDFNARHYGTTQPSALFEKAAENICSELLRINLLIEPAFPYHP